MNDYPLDGQQNKTAEDYFQMMSKVLLARTANETLHDAKEYPNPQMLFSEFWHEGELAILFADTNVGKSILAVQIADSISRGVPIIGFKLGVKAKTVCYVDFELSDKQFERRYMGEDGTHFKFDDKLLRVSINPFCMDFDSMENKIIQELKEIISEHSCRILIIDNITYLSSASTEKGSNALSLMKLLKQLKMEYDLSLLVLGHTPKRAKHDALSLNDLGGSRQLANFADSIFSIGFSKQDHDLRYLIQLKERATEKIYGSENVVELCIEKMANFLGFTFIGYRTEKEFLTLSEAADVDERNELIKIEKRNNPVISSREVAEMFGTSHTTVAKIWREVGL